MDEWSGDTSHLTTHNELSITNQSYLLLSSSSRPPKHPKVQFAQILGGKIGSQKCHFLGYK